MDPQSRSLLPAFKSSPSATRARRRHRTQAEGVQFANHLAPHLRTSPSAVNGLGSPSTTGDGSFGSEASASPIGAASLQPSSSPASSASAIASQLPASGVKGAPASLPPSRKSWADLLRSPARSPNGPAVTSTASSLAGSLASLPGASPDHRQGQSGPSSPPITSQSERSPHRAGLNGLEPGTQSPSLGGRLRGVETAFDAPYIHPRGLINNGNICFANAILQVLLHCAPFYNLFRRLRQNSVFDLKGSTPMVEATISFMADFATSQDTLDLPGDGKNRLATEAPFVADSVWDATRGNSRFDAMRRGQQEDAHEFLGFYLDTLHDELLVALDRSRQPEGACSEAPPPANIRPLESSGAWTEIGAKGRAAVTRSMTSKSSPISRIFDLQMRSVLHRPGVKDSITLEPNNAIQLDIQPDTVKTVEDALRNVSEPDTLSDLVSRNGVTVPATKQTFIEAFPPVLILHFKRFLFTSGRIQKTDKMITFAEELEIPASIQAPHARPAGDDAVRYRLFAVVYHHGSSALGGHYTAALRQHVSNTWIHVDDTSIHTTNVGAVTASRPLTVPGSGWEYNPSRSAYLLFYTHV